MTHYDRHGRNTVIWIAVWAVVLLVLWGLGIVP